MTRKVAVVGGRVAVVARDEVRLARLERDFPPVPSFAAWRDLDVGAPLLLAHTGESALVAQDLPFVVGRLEGVHVTVVAFHDVRLARRERALPLDPGELLAVGRYLDVGTRRGALGIREFARVARDLAVEGGRVAVFALEAVRLARVERALPRGRPFAVRGYRDVGALQSLALGRRRDDRTVVARNLAFVGERVAIVALDDVIITRCEWVFPGRVRPPSGVWGGAVVVALLEFVADALAVEFSQDALELSTVRGSVAVVALEYVELSRSERCFPLGPRALSAVGRHPNVFFTRNFGTVRLDEPTFIAGYPAVAGGSVAIVALEDVELARWKRCLPLGRLLTVGGHPYVGARLGALGFGERPQVALGLAFVGGRVAFFARDGVKLARPKRAFPLGRRLAVGGRLDVLTRHMVAIARELEGLAICICMTLELSTMLTVHAIECFRLVPQ